MCYRWGWNIGNHISCGDDDSSKIGVSNSMKMISKKSIGARIIDHYSDIDKESIRRKERPMKGVDVKLLVKLVYVIVILSITLIFWGK